MDRKEESFAGNRAFVVLIILTWNSIDESVQFVSSIYS